MSEEEATALEVYQQPENPDALPPNVTERRRENKKAFASQDEEMPEEKMDYMTLAKAGGRRGIAIHTNHTPATPIRYDFHCRSTPTLRVRGSVGGASLLPLGGLVRSHACS